MISFPVCWKNAQIHNMQKIDTWKLNYSTFIVKDFWSQFGTKITQLWWIWYIHVSNVKSTKLWKGRGPLLNFEAILLWRICISKSHETIKDALETLYNEILDYFNGIGSIQPYDAACGFVWGCCKAILNPYRREFVHHTVLLAYISQSTTKHTAASVHRPSVEWPVFPQLWKFSILWSPSYI